MLGGGWRVALVMSHRVAVGRAQQVATLLPSPLTALHHGLPSLGVCPVSVPVLLPAEEAADQFAPIILMIQPHRRFLLEPPGQDLGGRSTEEKTLDWAMPRSETVVEIADLCPHVCLSSLRIPGSVYLNK